MARRQIFYSFHFGNDVLRVQQIRNIGALEDNKPVSANEWETVKRGGGPAIEKWINDNLKYRTCLVVLIGTDTYDRKWVKYEIEKAWNDGKGVFGIYIHNINCMNNGKCRKGFNPFDYTFDRYGNRLSTRISVYDPSSLNAYIDVARNLENWVELAIESRTKY